MKAKIYLWLMVIGAALFQSVYALEKYYAEVENWVIFAGVKTSACIALSEFQEGYVVGLAMLPHSIGVNTSGVVFFSRKGWKIEPRTIPDIKLEIDSRGPWTGTAVVADGISDGFNIPVSLEFMAEISEGKSLMIQIGDWTERFDLTNTRKALAETAKCVADDKVPLTQPVADEANPFVKI